ICPIVLTDAHLAQHVFLIIVHNSFLSFFFFKDTATTDIYTLSLHDALPIYLHERGAFMNLRNAIVALLFAVPALIALPRSSNQRDRKSTRLNSSHVSISYAVFCLKKKTRASRMRF